MRKHTELSVLSIAHLDCDAFFAAIEKRDDPSLRDKPVLIGGGRRGVVSTCCYIARLYGVHSAMPMFKALKACPEAVVIAPNRAKYSEAGRDIRQRMQALTPLVQAVSIDEAYMDLSGTERINSGPPAQTLARLAMEIERDVGITVSIGLSTNKFLAKTASELDKPRGFAIIGETEAANILAPNPISFIHGVGPKFAYKLLQDGYRTVADIQAADERTLLLRYGETGQWLFKRAHGIDDRAVTPERARKSVSSETTFDKDISDPGILEDRLWKLCDQTAQRAKSAGVEGSVITLKLKTRAFRTLTRRSSIDAPTQLAQTLFRTARELLKRETNGTAYRLIGVGLSGLAPAGADSHDLIDLRIAKRAAAERASDEARARFGKDAVITGRAARMDRNRS